MIRSAFRHPCNTFAADCSLFFRRRISCLPAADRCLTVQFRRDCRIVEIGKDKMIFPQFRLFDSSKNRRTRDRLSVVTARIIHRIRTRFLYIDLIRIMDVYRFSVYGYTLDLYHRVRYGRVGTQIVQHSRRERIFHSNNRLSFCFCTNLVCTRGRSCCNLDRFARYFSVYRKDKDIIARAVFQSICTAAHRFQRISAGSFHLNSIFGTKRIEQCKRDRFSDSAFLLICRKSDRGRSFDGKLVKINADIILPVRETSAHYIEQL